MRSLKEKALRKRVDVHSKARQMIAAAKCTVATGRYRADNIYVLRIQCAVSYQVIGEGREGARNIGGSPSGWDSRVPIGRPAHVRVGHNAVNRMMEKPPSIRAN